MIDIRNIPSIKLAETLGFKQDGCLRNNYFDEIDGKWFDEYHYSLLRQDFVK